jgi:hypothetical protein
MLKAPGVPVGAQLAATVGAARGEVGALKARRCHVDRALGLRDDLRADVPRRGLDRERVGVGPAVPAQVQHRFASPVSGQLGLGSVGVEDAKAGDVSVLFGL